MENVKNVHMPVSFVILDKFSIMSQAVAKSPAYKLKSQNLLAKGRALGIKFIFASRIFKGYQWSYRDSKGLDSVTYCYEKYGFRMMILMKGH